MKLHMDVAGTDRIEKNIVLRAPRAQVWHALADAQAFGQWFGLELAGTFAPGARIGGRVTSPGYEHVSLELTIERLEPERCIAWSWHPNAVEPGVDYSAEPPTLVTFELQEVDAGTMLTVTESGFDSIPLARRAEAYRGNEQGWSEQMRAIERYVTGAA